MKVLVVEDMAVSRSIRRALLESHGHTVIEATNGADALAIAKQSPPDVVICDILMPVMDGFSLCRTWKADPDMKHIPFIFYTAAYTEPKDREFGMKLGADGFLTKPLEGEALVQAVEALVDASGRAEARPLAPSVAVDDKSYYREYNLRLVEKLEDNLQKLEQANAEIAARERELKEAQVRLELQVRDRTAELQFANRELEAFSYSVAHDLRTPLRAINGFSLALLEDCGDKLDHKGKDYLHRIRAASQRMGELIDSLLKLSRVSRRQLRRQPVDLSRLASEIAAELRQSQSQRKADFKVQQGLIVSGDQSLLRTVLENLLDNAWKYTNTREYAEIEFGTSVHDGEQMYYVRDNGVGFDMRHAGKLFTAFQRLHSESEFQGTGIGLATVARIVSRHGGGVWAESEPGMGATFYFSIPDPRGRHFYAKGSKAH
jgi:signal transduction histidine kinase